MTTWKEFVRAVDERAIDQLYSKAHIAVETVKMYNPRILDNIAVIANLQSGAYGVYNSGENQKIIPKDLEANLIYYGRVNRKNLDNIPKKTVNHENFGNPRSGGVHGTTAFTNNQTLRSLIANHYTTEPTVDRKGIEPFFN